MNEEQVTALANAFSMLAQLATNPIPHAKMKEVVKPIFEDMKKAGISEDLMLHYDQCISVFYPVKVIYGDPELVESLKHQTN